MTAENKVVSYRLSIDYVVGQGFRMASCESINPSVSPSDGRMTFRSLYFVMAEAIKLLARDGYTVSIPEQGVQNG